MKQYDLKTLSTASSKSSSTHGHGNIDKDGKMGTASRFVVTDSSKNVTVQEKLGNITLDGKIGTNADYFVYTTTNGVATSKQKIGNITTGGAIGSTANLPIITDTNGVLKAGSFSNTANTFAEGNHTHGSITNDGKLGTASRFVVTDSSKNITVQEKLGNITLDGKIGTNADYFVYTTTNGVATSKQKIGNITTGGAIGSTANLPLITTTSGVITTGTFGSGANTFAEGNHNHSGTYVDTVVDKNITNGSEIAEIKAGSTVKGTIHHPKVNPNKQITTPTLMKISYNYDGHVTASDTIGASDLPSHTHTQSQITDFAHTHTKSQISDFSHSHDTWSIFSGLNYSTLYYNTDLRLCELILNRRGVTVSNVNTWLEWETKIPSDKVPNGMITGITNYGQRCVIEGQKFKIVFTSAVTTAVDIQASFMWHY